ncbi:CitB Response regulator containing a CheY-like receiver domain and an HTH DNA-binding domain [Candidatus Nanopelagicaceae bacterium]
MPSKAAQTSRVLLINDDSFELATMAASLRLHSINVVGEASNMLLAENLFRSLQPEAVLIDLQFSGEEAIGLLQRLRKVAPTLGIVITTSCPDLRLFGLLEKNIPSGSKIILKRSISDLSVITYALNESLASASDGSKMKWINFHKLVPEESFTTILTGLTDIQIETLRLVSQGLSNSEIAKVRFVSEKSVEQIVARIAQHLSIVPDRRRNLRVALAGEYFKWLGAPRH